MVVGLLVSLKGFAQLYQSKCMIQEGQIVKLEIVIP